jgi:hypothetical protein
MRAALYARVSTLVGQNPEMQISVALLRAQGCGWRKIGTELGVGVGTVVRAGAEKSSRKIHPK